MRYLAQHPPPEKPQDLENHVICAFGRDKKTVSWSFSQPRQDVERIKLVPKVLTASEESLLGFCLEGIGLALLPPGLSDTDIAEGRLVRLLGNYEIEPRRVYMIMPREKRTSPVVGAYVAIVQAFVQNTPGLFRA